MVHVGAVISHNCSMFPALTLSSQLTAMRLFSAMSDTVASRC